MLFRSNLVGAFQALGTLLAVGLMMLPAASARLWSDDLTAVIGLSVVIAMGSAYAGLVASYHHELPAGPAIILAAGVFWLLSLAFGRRGLLTRRLTRRHLEA